MLKLPRTQDAVYLVTRPIPAINALPGDEIVFCPTDADWPVALLRQPAPELAAAIPEGSVRFLASYEPDGVVPVGEEAIEAAPRTASDYLRAVLIATGHTPGDVLTGHDVDAASCWCTTTTEAPRPALRLVR